VAANVALLRGTRLRLRAATRSLGRSRPTRILALLGLWASVATVRLALQRLGARLRAERTERFVERATRVARESIDWEATLAHVARLAVPFLGDVCVVVLREERGLRVAAAAHADATRTPALAELLARYPLDLDAAHGPGWTVRHALPELVPDVDLEAFAPGDDPGARLCREVLAAVGLRSYMGVPLVVAERTLGAIAFGITTEGRRHRDDDLRVARELASRCALAIEHARLYREAREATRAREELLAVVSHDLRSPLAAVRLAAGLLARLARQAASPELRRSVDALNSASSRAARLVDDLVDAARLEGGRLALARAAHPAAELAREALAVAEPVASAQGVTLSVDVAPEAGTVDCDAHRVLQVLSNLVDNSLKAMPSGGALRLAVRRGGEEVAFEVSDTGPGIAPEDQPRVFERWWRSPGARWAGSGLGLAIARGIVEAHGGRIALRSAPGEGTTFTFTLPARAG
jgi:signal transduction histidine kinase